MRTLTKPSVREVEHTLAVWPIDDFDFGTERSAPTLRSEQDEIQSWLDEADDFARQSSKPPDVEQVDSDSSTSTTESRPSDISVEAPAADPLAVQRHLSLVCCDCLHRRR